MSMFDLKVTRRDFLVGGAKVAALASVAPAIIKFENAMKIWVPPEKKIITDPYSVNFTMSGMMPGSQVYVKNQETGEVLINEVVRERTKGWNLPDDVRAPLQVAIRNRGHMDYIQCVGGPVDGGKTTIKGIHLIQDGKVRV